MEPEISLHDETLAAFAKFAGVPLARIPAILTLSKVLYFLKEGPGISGKNRFTIDVERGRIVGWDIIDNDSGATMASAIYRLDGTEELLILVDKNGVRHDPDP